MSKLLDALKRAEQLRKQKLAQEEAARAAAANATLPPQSQLEAALIAEEVKMAARRVHELYEEEKRKKSFAQSQLEETNTTIRANEAKARADRALAEESSARQQIEEQVAASASVDRIASVQAAEAAAARHESEEQAKAAAAQRLAAELAAQVAATALEAKEAALTQAARERAAMDREVAAAMAKRIEMEQAAELATGARVDAETLAAQAAATRDEVARRLKLHNESRRAEAASAAQQIERAIQLRTEAEASLQIEIQERDALHAEEKKAAETKLAQEDALREMIALRLEEEKRANDQLRSRLAAEKQLTETLDAKMQAEQDAVASAEKLAAVENELAFAARLAIAKESEELGELQSQRSRAEAQVSAKAEEIQRLRSAAESATTAALAEQSRLQHNLARRVAEREENEQKLLDEALAMEQTARDSLAEVSVRLSAYVGETEKHFASLRAGIDSAQRLIAQQKAAGERTLAIEIARRTEIEAQLRSEADAQEAREQAAIAELTSRIAQEQELSKVAIAAATAENIDALNSLRTKRAELDAALAEHREEAAAQDRTIAIHKAEIDIEMSKLNAERIKFHESSATASAAFVESENRLAHELAGLRAARLDTEKAAALRQAAEDAREADLVAQADAAAKLVAEEMHRAAAEAAAETAARAAAQATRALTEATNIKLAAAARAIEFAEEQARLAHANAEEATRLAAIEESHRKENEAVTASASSSGSNPLIEMQLPPPASPKSTTTRWLPSLPAIAIAVAFGALLGRQFSSLQTDALAPLTASVTPVSQLSQPTGRSPIAAAQTDTPVALKLDTILRNNPKAKP